MSFINCDVGVRSRDVALVPVVPAHSRPSVALVLLHHEEHLAFMHGYGPLAGACGQRRARIRGNGMGVQSQKGPREAYNCTWEIVERCALTDRCGQLLFLKVVIELCVDGLGGVGLI